MYQVSIPPPPNLNNNNPLESKSSEALGLPTPVSGKAGKYLLPLRVYWYKNSLFYSVLKLFFLMRMTDSKNSFFMDSENYFFKVSENSFYSVVKFLFIVPINAFFIVSLVFF